VTKIHARLWRGRIEDCEAAPSEFAVVHACKSPCHQRAVGYRGALPGDHPNYLSYQDGNQLYLNLIDPPVPLFQRGSFKAALAFLREHVPQLPTLIHCNLGLSRAPSIALLYLAKVAEVIDRTSYRDAARGFVTIYPAYEPGLGIQTFLEAEWERLE